MSSQSESSKLKKRELELKSILMKKSPQRSQAHSKRATTAPAKCKTAAACEDNSTKGLEEADETQSEKHIPSLDSKTLHIHPSPYSKPIRAASTPAQQDTSVNTGDSIDLVDDALKHLEEESICLGVCSNPSASPDLTPFNSSVNGVSQNISAPPNPTAFPACHSNNIDAVDLDLMQCPSPHSTTFNSTDFNCVQSSSLSSTRNPGFPNYPNSPAHTVSSNSPIPSIESFENRQGKGMSLQNGHLDHATTPNSGDLRKTALTNSQHHHALSSIVTRNRQGHIVTIDLTPAMNASPDMAEDLYDWLELTGWHDVDRRTQEIERYRKLEALEKQQATIESERAAILRSYHQETHGLNRQSETPNAFHPIRSNTYNVSPPQGRHGIFQDATMTGLGQDVSPRANNPAYPKGIKREKEPVVSSKLARAFRRRPSATRPGRDRSASPDVFQKNDQSENITYRARDFSRTRAEEHAPTHSPSNALSRRPLESRIARPEACDNKRRSDIFTERREYRECLEHPDYHSRGGKRDLIDMTPKRDYERERRNASYPTHINIGQRGDTRFFVMKSYNLTNIYDCQDQGLWATQTQNEGTLRKAFEETKNVVLFFSANKSHAFMGYARMTSLPSTDCARPSWWPAINWKITEPFEVEWISKMHCEDAHLKHIRNSLNENLPITRCRDGQEIEEDAGREMVAILNQRAVQEVNRMSSR
ncbi:YT521-B-like domain-containing protein [Biscogniauxia marginata]|nr:YT521-B-like domain-containing protein [Biscogniauxia marginata]